MNVVGFGLDRDGSNIEKLMVYENEFNVSTVDEFFDKKDLIDNYIKSIRDNYKKKPSYTDKKSTLNIYFSINSEDLITYFEDPNMEDNSFTHIKAKEGCYNSLVIIQAIKNNKSFYRLATYAYEKDSNDINNILNTMEHIYNSASMLIPGLIGGVKAYNINELWNKGYKTNLGIYVFKKDNIKVLSESISMSSKSRRENNDSNRNDGIPAEA